MSDRQVIQTDWEDQYVDKVEHINQIIYNQTIALRQISSQPNYPTEDNGMGLGKNELAVTVAGDFVLPETIRLASVNGGQVSIPTGRRGPYHKARDIAAQNSGYAGFQSISEDMYSFVHPEQNLFAQDFIPILILIYNKLAPALKVDTIRINSALRKVPIDVEWDAHMGGYAVDIRATGSTRYTVADICWELGLRAVAIGQTFVHVDSGPDPISGWGYPGVPVYRGPSSSRG